METQDGFIVGIYNYCDRWCERCPLTSRCRVFVEEQRMSFEMQHTAGAGAAPALRSLGALAAVLEESADAVPADLPADTDLALPREVLLPDDATLHQRARALGHRLWDWLAPEGLAQDAEVKDAVEVVQHYAVFIGPKMFRALSGREAGVEDGLQSDALGSAKAALLALERMTEAWLCLAERGAISVVEAAPVLTEIQYIAGELERQFPRVRDFVRPGLDEPAAVAMLEWRERG